MSWTQTFIAATLIVTLMLGGVVGLAYWAAPGWAGSMLSMDTGWRDASNRRTSRWYSRRDQGGHETRVVDYCDRLMDFDNVFVRNFVASELDLNASQNADFQALVVAFAQGAERLRGQTCNDVSDNQPLPERFMHYARAVDTMSEEMHAVSAPLSRFYQGLSPNQRTKLETVMTHRGRH